MHGDAGRQRARGEHGAQLDHEDARRTGAGSDHRVRGGARGVRRRSSERPNQWVWQHRGHRLAQRRPGAVYELADRPLGQPHPRRHPRPRDPVQRCADQRVTLTRRQGAQFRQGGARRRPLLHQVLQRLAAAGLIRQRRFDRPLRPARRVAHDRVQPAPQMRHLRPSAQSGKGVQERLLHDIVGAAVGHQSPGVRQQFRLVALARSPRTPPDRPRAPAPSAVRRAGGPPQPRTLDSPCPSRRRRAAILPGDAA